MIVKLKMPVEGKICVENLLEIPFSKYMVCDKVRDEVRHNSVILI